MEEFFLILESRPDLHVLEIPTIVQSSTLFIFSIVVFC